MIAVALAATASSAEAATVSVRYGAGGVVRGAPVRWRVGRLGFAFDGRPVLAEDLASIPPMGFWIVNVVQFVREPPQVPFTVTQ